LASRVLGPSAKNLFKFETLPLSACEGVGPCATVQTGETAGTIEIAGPTPVEMAFALGHYCEKELLMSFAWQKNGGFQVANLPLTLPPLSKPIKLQKKCAPGEGGGCYTHYMNVVTGSYGAWNWDSARWMQENDWMALHGINLVFAFNGQEQIYYETFLELGLNSTEIQSSFNGPAFLSWSRSYEAGWENGGQFDAQGRFINSLDNR
jgi:hypothetical protein